MAIVVRELCFVLICTEAITKITSGITDGRYNAALLQNTSQSTTIDDRGASDHAVDGCVLTTFNKGCCTHTEPNEQSPWWAVDLGMELEVHEVNMLNRGDCCEERLQKTTVYGSSVGYNPDNDEDKTFCAYNENSVGPNKTAMLKCEKNFTARYVIVQKNITEPLTLCEVEVEVDCHHCRGNATCNKTDGRCPNGMCEDGYTGSKCEQVCPENTYGESCNFTCEYHHCRNNTICNPVDGTCPDGLCEDGYTSDKCDQECPHNTYGRDCNLTCDNHHCRHSAVCYPQNGTCPGGLCDNGYTEESCNQECNDGTYGYNCNYNCSENCKLSCDKFTSNGNCIDGECFDGYIGDNCTTVCPDGTFGSGCLSECHCQINTCNHVTGICECECEEGYEGETCSIPTSASIAWVGGVVGGLIIIALLVTLIVVFVRRRKNPRSRNAYQNENHMVQAGDEYTVDKTAKKKFVQDEEPLANCGSAVSPDLIYMNVAAPPPVTESSTHIKVEDLGSYIARQKQEEVPFEEEYKSIPDVIGSWSEAEIPELRIKNRYRNIIPYNHNRVKLQQQNGNKLSDYINASLIKDNNGQQSYIAALGATKETLHDMWRMIWEHNVQMIVMVTNLVEQLKIKCEQYWPSEGFAQYGDIEVQLDDEETFPHHIERSFTATKNKERKVVKQYHYTGWPDKKTPDDLGSVWELIKTIRRLRQNRKVPILIHCSAGVGRTGTLIALDILLEQLEAEGAVDVYNCVMELRKQRTLMVQTLVQYKFIYESLHQITAIGSTRMLCSDIGNILQPQERGTLAKQFMFLSSVKPIFTETELEFGKLDNKENNRDISVVPSCNQRVKLLSKPEYYINAVYVESYNKPRGFCVTQIPLPHTVYDFWEMIQEEKCTVIVCCQREDDDTQWLPEKGATIEMEHILVETNEVVSKGGLKISEIVVKTMQQATDAQYANMAPDAKDAHVTKVIEFENLWADIKYEKRSMSLLWTVFNIVQDLQKTSDNKLVTVMCRNGANESGLYVASHILLEMVNAEQEIDTFGVVKKIRQNRPEFIASEEQYVFLHKILQQYIAEFEEYSN